VAEVSFVLSLFTRLTDGWTDGQTDVHFSHGYNTAPHSTQCGKNDMFGL